MPIADLVAKAAASGYRVLPLTDINTTMGVVDFVFECKKLNLRPVAGCEFRNGNELLYVALAKDNQGYAELNVFLMQLMNDSQLRNSMGRAALCSSDRYDVDTIMEKWVRLFKGLL